MAVVPPRPVPLPRRNEGRLGLRPHPVVEPVPPLPLVPVPVPPDEGPERRVVPARHRSRPAAAPGGGRARVPRFPAPATAAAAAAAGPPPGSYHRQSVGPAVEERSVVRVGRRHHQGPAGGTVPGVRSVERGVPEGPLTRGSHPPPAVSDDGTGREPPPPPPPSSSCHRANERDDDDCPSPRPPPPSRDMGGGGVYVPNDGAVPVPHPPVGEGSVVRFPRQDVLPDPVHELSGDAVDEAREDVPGAVHSRGGAPESERSSPHDSPRMNGGNEPTLDVPYRGRRGRGGRRRSAIRGEIRKRRRRRRGGGARRGERRRLGGVKEGVAGGVVVVGQVEECDGVGIREALHGCPRGSVGGVLLLVLGLT